MSNMTPRELLAAADRHRRTERAAEYARVRIRLWEKPVQRKGLLGFLAKATDTAPDQFFTAAETDAIYEALLIVQRENREAADRYEQRVTTSGSAS